MTHVNTRVQKYRAALRKAGLRPVQLWVPDTRQPNFDQECRRQCQLAAQADRGDLQLQHLLDNGLLDVTGWTD